MATNPMAGPDPIQRVPASSDQGEFHDYVADILTLLETDIEIFYPSPLDNSIKTCQH